MSNSACRLRASIETSAYACTIHAGDPFDVSPAGLPTLTPDIHSIAYKRSGPV